RFVTGPPLASASLSAWSSGTFPVAARVVAAVTAFRVAVCWLSTLAPSMRTKASRLPPASTTAMHCGTFISSAFATAPCSTASAPAWVSVKAGATWASMDGVYDERAAGARMRRSELDLRAQLDHLVRRDAEELRRRPGVAREKHEERAAPGGKVRPPGRDERLVPDEVARAARERGEPLRGGAAQDIGHVGGFHEPVGGDDPPASSAARVGSPRPAPPATPSARSPSGPSGSPPARGAPGCA